jgi:hypothetical protein
MKILSYLSVLVTLCQNTLGPISAKENTATLKWTHQNGLPVARAPSHASKTQAWLHVMTNNNHLTRRNSLQVCSFMNTKPHTTDEQSKILYRSTATHLFRIPRRFQKGKHTHTYITRSSLSLLTLSRLRVAVDFNNKTLQWSMHRSSSHFVKYIAKRHRKYYSKSQRPQ